MPSRKSVNARRRKNKLATGMWNSDDGRTLDQSIEIELAALTPLEQIWVYNFNDGNENHWAGNIQIDDSATNTGGLLSASVGTAPLPHELGKCDEPIGFLTVRDRWPGMMFLSAGIPPTSGRAVPCYTPRY